MSEPTADKEPTFVILGKAEEAMKFQFHTILYADDKPHVERRTPEQIAREPGFYWVKFRGEWNVEEWRGGEWLMTGTEETTREDVGEIGPRIEPPVPVDKMAERLLTALQDWDVTELPEFRAALTSALKNVTDGR